MPSCLSPIVGTAFRPLTTKAHLATLPSGAILHLDPEPTHRTDPNAIRVLSNGHCLGYIPSSLNPRIDFTKFASNLTILSILAGCPDHKSILERDLDGNPYVSLSWAAGEQ